MADPVTSAMACAVVVSGSTEIKRVLTGQGPTFGPVASGFVVGLGIIVLGIISAQVASLFSALLIITALIYNGTPIFQAVTVKAK